VAFFLTLCFEVKRITDANIPVKVSNYP